MRIGIDILPLRRHRTGIGNYVQGLLDLLPDVAPEHEYYLYSNRPVLLPNPNRFHQVNDGFFSWCPGSLWLLTRCGDLARRDRLDVYWATGAVLPPSLHASTLKIITIYDLVWRHCPDTTTRYNLFVQKLCAEKAIRSADLILVISQSTQQELIEVLDVSQEKIRVVYPVIPERYRPHDPLHAAEYISAKYDVPKRYMATVGTVEPRKNLKVLVEALAILKSKDQLDCALLVVGAKGWKTSELFRRIQEVGLTTSDIRFLGYMSDVDLPSFYSGAQIFLFPTLYEGFGLPPVEAMACGVPVIASNAPAMPEILGEAAILEPPDSPDRFAAAILQLLTDPELGERMRTRGLHRAKRFSPKNSMQQLLDCFTSRGECREVHIG
jgi:glycosyltransferase involved in cell wall biosynthesis